MSPVGTGVTYGTRPGASFLLLVPGFDLVVLLVFFVLLVLLAACCVVLGWGEREWVSEV